MRQKRPKRDPRWVKRERKIKEQRKSGAIPPVNTTVVIDNVRVMVVPGNEEVH